VLELTVVAMRIGPKTHAATNGSEGVARMGITCASTA
jgi:hypothetical protein